jgi:hypothetical protein
VGGENEVNRERKEHYDNMVDKDIHNNSSRLAVVIH